MYPAWSQIFLRVQKADRQLHVLLSLACWLRDVVWPGLGHVYEYIWPGIRRREAGGDVALALGLRALSLSLGCKAAAESMAGMGQRLNGGRRPGLPWEACALCGLRHFGWNQHAKLYFIDSEATVIDVRMSEDSNLYLNIYTSRWVQNNSLYWAKSSSLSAYILFKLC